MANPYNKIFSSVTLTVDLMKFQHHESVVHKLNSYGLKKAKGFCYEFRGSFEDAEEVFLKLSALKRSDDLEHVSRDTQDHSFLAHTEPVQVTKRVMDYIIMKYSEELHRSVGSDVSMDVNEDKTEVRFLPRYTVSQTRSLFARERFITFYQNIATDLKEREYDIDSMFISTNQKYLEREFPKLLFRSDSGRPRSRRVSVIGSYADLLRFGEFLKNGGTISHYQRQQSQRTANGDFVSSATQKLQKEEETCPICLDTIKETEKKTLPQCKHSFCRDCLEKAFESKPSCPVCGRIYGSLKGTQPENGTMEYSTVKAPLPGYEKYGSIVIRYEIPSGIQGEEHPNPGQSYSGTSRVAFLPDSSEGRKVLHLLQKAFDQRLIFTIGQSSTSGRSNVVTWNDIHHKTSRDGGPTKYGYPDPDYLYRVQEELKAKGIY
ncbi:hypothetical protein AGOR_G00048960 [Albula goreensis]|uniref:E3 ubiquitin-protein ligase n=1 Tax=Albula goreensis TaxID=1534307 RepID=A0A8T3DVE5_9TELE|nr:hypothetical protein AGOR_G00048960 [Albula goreensis]